MTTSHKRLPVAGTAEPDCERDPELAQAYAESVDIDSCSEEIEVYLKIAGATPLADQSDTSQTDGGA